MSKLIANQLNLDPFAARCLIACTLTWFFGSMNIYASVFILEPDTNGLIHLNNTVQGTFLSSHPPPTPDGDGAKWIDIQLGMASTVFFLGWIFGSAALSAVSDLFGRRRAFGIGSTVMVAAMAMLAWSWSIEVFLLARFLVGLGFGGASVTAYVWGQEWIAASSYCRRMSTIAAGVDGSDHVISPGRRSRGNSRYSELTSGSGDESILVFDDDPDALQSLSPAEEPSNVRAESSFQLMFAAGGVLLPLLAFCFPYWRSLLRVIFIITTLCIVWIYMVVPESPRWLLFQHRLVDYRAVVSCMDGGDLVPIPPVAVDSAPSSSPGTRRFLMLTRPPLLYLMLALAVIWFGNAFVYYGISLNANRLPGNVYVLNCLFCMLGFPSQFLAIGMERRLGLHRSFSICMAVCVGVLLLMSASAAAGVYWITSMLSVFGMLISAMQFSFCYIITAACFDTSVRQTGVGTCVVISRIGAICASFVLLLFRRADGQLGFEAMLILAAVIGLGVVSLLLGVPSIKAR